MKKGIRYARLSASIVAVLYGAAAHAQSVTWDPTGSDVNPPVDGSGNWDLTDSTWYNSGTAMDVQWSNAVPYSAVFGDPTSAAASATGTSNFVTLTNSINVQDITLGTATNGATNGFYNIVDDGGSETLTLNGNLIKASAVGESLIELTNPLVLAAGDHVVAINDTPGPVPELSIDNPITGSGSITMNNAFNSSGYTQYGTLVLNVDSDYSGGTNIVDGAVTANTQGALGTGTCVISNQGALEFGGNGTIQASNMSVTTPIEITRNTYTGTNFSDYPDAIISSNTGNSANVVNINGPFVVDSTNAQIAANTSTIVINSNITQGPDVTNGMLTVDGDFAGYVTLNGDNSALTGGIQLIGGVELNVSSLANLGGPTATLIFNGSGTFHPVGGFISNFGSLNVNYSTFAGGIDVDSGSTFTIGQNLGTSGNTSGSVGMRGAGTLILSGTDSLGGSTYWDGWSAAPNNNTTTGGVVDVTGTVALGSIHLRSPTVNITGTLTANDPGNSGQFDSVGESSNGTNGGPDEAIVNITGNGEFNSTTGDTFYVSDGANTQGTINLSGSGQFITGGVTEVGVNPGATGTIIQTGGSLTINRNGNFGFVLGDGRNANGGNGPVGTYNLSTGTFSDENGEIYVGEGNNGGPGIGYWTQTGGTATFGNWFVVGREGAKGTVLISGGSLTKDASNGGANVSIGEGGANVCTLTVDNTGSFTIDSGQFFDGNNSSVGIVNVGSLTDPGTAAPSLSVASNWFAVGRNGTSNGTLNLYDGSITITNVTTGPAGSQNYFDISGDGGSPTGVVNVYGGTLSAQQTLIGENGSGTATVNIYGGTVSLGTTIFANSGSVSGTVNLNGGILISTGITAQNGVLNESGGTGPGFLYFNGGTLSTTPGNVNNNFVGMKVTSVVSAGGAIINANGGYININSALTHNSNVTTDGGLTITGTGTVQLGTAGSHTPQNTYNGGTTVNGGTLIISTAGALPSGSNVANSAAFVVGANSTAGNVSGTGTTTVNSGVAFTASNFTQGLLVDNGSAQINGSGTIGTSNDLGAITGTGTMTIGTGSSNNTIHLATNSGQSTLGSLVISSGSDLDIGNNSLILHYSSPATDPIASIAAWIKNGFYDLAGPQITSSDIAADDAASGLSYGIGYADGADGVVGGLPSGEVEIMFTLLGDANLDGTVNAEDFTPFSAHLGQSGMWDAGDFNYDGTVNAEDFTPFSANLGQSATLAAGAGILESADGLSLANVPEPASVVGLLAVGGLCALRRRRRKV